MSLSRTHQIFVINSTNRLSGSDGNFSYELKIDSSADYDSVVVLGCSIPKSFYIVQAGFNTFTLLEGNQPATITVPAGNYSYLSWIAVVVPLLNTASPNGWIYNITFPDISQHPNTGLFTYTVSGNSSQPSIVTTVNVYEQLGFAQNTTNTFVNNSLTSTAVINFTPETTLFLCSDIAGNKEDNVLQEIYDQNTLPFSYIVYQNTNLEAYSKKLMNVGSRSYNFNITNENKQSLFLNGRNCLITICVYRKENINDIIRLREEIKTKKSISK